MNTIEHYQVLNALRYDPKVGRFFWIKNGREAGGVHYKRREKRDERTWRIKIGALRLYRRHGCQGGRQGASARPVLLRWLQGPIHGHSRHRIRALENTAFEVVDGRLP